MHYHDNMLFLYIKKGKLFIYKRYICKLSQNKLIYIPITNIVQLYYYFSKI